MSFNAFSMHFFKLEELNILQGLKLQTTFYPFLNLLCSILHVCSPSPPQPFLFLLGCQEILIFLSHVHRCHDNWDELNVLAGITFAVSPLVAGAPVSLVQIC